MWPCVRQVARTRCTDVVLYILARKRDSTHTSTESREKEQRNAALAAHLGEVSEHVHSLKNSIY